MRRLANSATGFGMVTRVLHWAMAIGVLTMLGFGTYLGQIEVNLGNLWLFGLHKSVGLTLLALALVRLAWHRISPPPAPIGGVPAWQDRAARWTHRSFYVLLIAAPLAGWAGSSATGIDTVLFGQWTVPRVAPVSEAWETVFFGLHSVLTNILFALILVHVAGALTRRDGTLRRMLSGSVS